MDIDFDNLAPARHPSERVVDTCIFRAAEQYKLNPLVLKAIRRQEAGKVGMANRNTDDSYDLGIMQLNTINLPTIQNNFPKISPYDLIYKACINVYIGAWFLKGRIERAGGDVWKGVGNYHSGTPSLHDKYVEGVKRHYRKVRAEYINKKRAALSENGKAHSYSRRQPKIIGIHRTD